MKTIPFWTAEIHHCKESGEVFKTEPFSNEIAAQEAFDKTVHKKLDCGTQVLKHPYTESFHSGVIGFIRLIAIKNLDKNSKNRQFFTRRELYIKA